MSVSPNLTCDAQFEVLHVKKNKVQRLWHPKCKPRLEAYQALSSRHSRQITQASGVDSLAAFGKTSPTKRSPFSSPWARRLMARANFVGTALILVATLVGPCMSNRALKDHKIAICSGLQLYTKTESSAKCSVQVEEKSRIDLAMARNGRVEGIALCRIFYVTSCNANSRIWISETRKTKLLIWDESKDKTSLGLSQIVMARRSWL